MKRGLARWPAALARVVCASLCLLGPPVLAQEAGSGAQPATANTWWLRAASPRPVAKLAVAGWLRGQYVGTGLNGDIELSFLPPRAGAMIGSFRLMRNERTEFSEHLQMIEVDGSLHLRVKHFTPEFVGWEDKDQYFTFRLVEVRDDELRFEGLTYRRTDDGVQIFIAMRSHGELREQLLSLRRLP